MVKKKRKENNPDDGELKVFSGRANVPLATDICRYLKILLGKAKVDVFPDGELLTKIEEDVRGRDVFIIEPTCPPVNEYLVELLLFIDSLRRASAHRITAVIPYFGYGRQDRKDEGRVPISAKVAANQLASAGAHRVLTMDLHSAQIQGFFDIPVDHLFAEPVLSAHFISLGLKNMAIVSPDVGNVKISGVYAQRLGGELAIVAKRRLSASEAKAEYLIGDVKGKTAIMIDDMISTAGTICSAARLVKDAGADAIYVAATHGLFCGPAIERLDASPIDGIVVTNTVPLPEPARKSKKITVLSVADVLGEAIKRIHSNRSVSGMFCKEGPVIS